MRLDGGDLSARAEVPSGDELGELAMRFNQMAATIQQRTGELEAQYKTGRIRTERALQSGMAYTMAKGHPGADPLSG